MTGLRSTLCAGLLLLAGVAGALVAAPSAAADRRPSPPTPHGDIVVKLNPGTSVSALTSAFPVVVRANLLASRGIYLVRPSDPHVAADPARTASLVNSMAAKTSMVTYAEVDQEVVLSDNQFHGWPYGSPDNVTTDPSTYWNQRMVTSLSLARAHSLSTGAGVNIAVLDTGVDPNQPVLRGKVGTGYDYTTDTTNTLDRRQNLDDDHDGVIDCAYGHGTFVAGLAELVAPGARILPYRVLDSDGYGDVYDVAQAILDATNAGAQIINLSLGTADQITSKVLTDAISTAQRAGVLVVGAAGNDASSAPHYPAAMPGVLAVGALAGNGTQLASFSDFGSWVQVLAPGEDVVGPLPGNTFAQWSGTSMAAPIVSGQAALVLTSHRSMSLSSLVWAIDSTASPLTGARFGSINIPSSQTWTGGQRHP